MIIDVIKDDDPCGQNKPLLIANTTGEIFSPDYPEQYPNSSNCQWLITVPGGFVVSLTFVEFDLEYG